MSAAGLAAGVTTPPVLVRQTNRLDWYSELAMRGFAVVSLETVRAFETGVEVNGKKIHCPEGHILLIDPNHVRISEYSSVR